MDSNSLLPISNRSSDTIESSTALAQLKEDNPPYVALDTETTGVEFHDEAFALTCAWMHNGRVKSFFFDIKKVGLYLGGEEDEAREIVAATNRAIFHNAKFDIQKLILGEILHDRIEFEDTEGLAHLLDEHRPKRLKYLAKELLGLETDEDEVLKATRRRLKLKKSDGYHKIPRDILEPYALKDAEFTVLLFEVLYPQICQATDLRTLYEHEKELTWVLLDVETKGIGIDEPYVTKTLQQYSGDEVKLELRCRDIAGIEEFNPRSNPQIKEYFEGKGIVRDKYDKSNLLAIKDPMGQAILSLRTTAKMRSTYLTPMHQVCLESKKLSSAENVPILHPHFKQYKPITGRMASGKVEE